MNLSFEIIFGSMEHNNNKFVFEKNKENTSYKYPNPNIWRPTTLFASFFYLLLETSLEIWLIKIRLWNENYLTFYIRSLAMLQLLL